MSSTLLWLGSFPTEEARMGSTWTGVAPHTEAGTVACKLPVPTTILTWKKTKTFGHLLVSLAAYLMSGPPIPHNLYRELRALVYPRPRHRI